MSFTLDSLHDRVAPMLVGTPVIFSVRGSLVAVFLLIYFSKVIHVNLSYALKGDYDLVQANYRSGADAVAATWKSKTIQRAYAAHENTWEAFISFSAAILLALNSGAESSHGAELEKLANAFVFVRVAYIVVYVLAASKPVAVIRSAVFLVGLAILLRIFSIGVGGAILK